MHQQMYFNWQADVSLRPDVHNIIEYAQGFIFFCRVYNLYAITMTS